jgi:RNA polymerase sigma-70 factor (ECF subfamily)
MAHPLSALADVDLCDRLRQGDADALRVLYDRYSGLVYTLACRILSRAEEAEDLTQDIFLSFWKEPKFDAQRASLGTYLSLLTRSRALNRLSQRNSRLRSLQRLQILEDLAPSGPTPIDYASRDEQQRHLTSALNQLSDSQRQVLNLSYYQGLSQSEIAQHLNLPLGTVKTHARQGLIKLRQLLNDVSLLGQ